MVYTDILTLDFNFVSHAFLEGVGSGLIIWFAKCPNIRECQYLSIKILCLIVTLLSSNPSLSKLANFGRFYAKILQ